MAELDRTLPAFLTEPSRIGPEISVTGRWLPVGRRLPLRPGAGTRAMRRVCQDLHLCALGDSGVLAMSIDPVVGSGAVLVHHVFRDADAMATHLSSRAADLLSELVAVATPGIHLVRGLQVPAEATAGLSGHGVPTVPGELLFGYVRDDYRRPDPRTAVGVTAQWVCHPGRRLDDLIGWWQRVGTDAHDSEPGLRRFEAYRVPGEEALVIHEAFADTGELRFHLTKGTAATYKKDIDEVAAPRCYYFRGPVSPLIQGYSRLMRLPATYTRRGSGFTRAGGSMSDGTTG